jgi:septum formation protein
MSDLKQLVLASGSPRRKKLLSQINCSFLVDVSAVEEIVDPEKSPPEVVESLARQKAMDVAHRHPYSCIIGADTIVVKDNKILGKPESRNHARQLLASLNNRKHQVITGVCLVETDFHSSVSRERCFHEVTTVQFGSLNHAEIAEYVSTGSPMDKAGGYGIQDDWGALFVKEIHGDYNNVVGFPLYTFYQNMKEFAPSLLPHPISKGSS